MPAEAREMQLNNLMQKFNFWQMQQKVKIAKVMKTQLKIAIYEPQAEGRGQRAVACSSLRH